MFFHLYTESYSPFSSPHFLDLTMPGYPQKASYFEYRLCRGVPEQKFKVRRGWVWEGVPERAGDTNDWCVRSGDMGTVGQSKVRKSPCKIVVPHSSVANRNSHADPPEPISLIVAEVSPT